jgi:hypothetical protein
MGSQMKVFALALHRSGSVSMTKALDMLGIHTLFARSIPELHENLDRYDGFTHDAVTMFYKELDEKYPGSKFIFLRREKESWIEACRRFPTLKPETVHEQPTIDILEGLYRSIPFDEAIYREVYDDVIRDVHSYFRDRPDDLLIMDLVHGEGWEKLCPFLGKDVPDGPFPMANTARQTYLSPWYQAKLRFRIVGSRVKQALLGLVRARQ